MARITVEDCIDKVINRFELVVLAAQRAKHINSGANLTIERDNDKSSVLALREIALGNVKPELLREGLIKSFQTSSKIEQVEEEVILEDKEEELDSFDYIPDNADLYNSDAEIEDELFDDMTHHATPENSK